MRTSIELHGEEPLLSAPDQRCARSVAQRLVECPGGAGFALERGPLWTCALTRLDAAISCLMLTAHHLMLDRASLQMVLQDLADLYEATCARRHRSCRCR